MNKHRLFIVLPLIFCLLSCSGNRSSLDKKVMINDVRYIIRKTDSRVFIDLLHIKTQDFKDGICESTFNIDNSIARNIFFVREKPVKCSLKNDFDDSQYRLALRFDDYSEIPYFPLYYKITINNYPSNDGRLRLEETFYYYDPFSFVWVPNYNGQSSVSNDRLVTADFIINTVEGEQFTYKLKFREFRIAYNDEPVGEEVRYV
jgi:hypothetical protein